MVGAACSGVVYVGGVVLWFWFVGSGADLVGFVCDWCAGGWFGNVVVLSVLVTWFWVLGLAFVVSVSSSCLL